MLENFWVVWCPTAGSPTVRHMSAELAQAEASRLAGNRPGEEFFVLRMIGRAMRRAPVEWEEPSEELPF